MPGVLTTDKSSFTGYKLEIGEHQVKSGSKCKTRNKNSITREQL